MFDTFEDIRADISTRLTDAARNRRSPMHVPAVVTGDIDVRAMVLRDFDADRWVLRFHTDARAPKVAAVESDPRMAALFYDPPDKVQIRVRGTGRIVRDGAIADDAWAESTNFARRCYLGDAPGDASDVPTSGLPAAFEGCEPNDDQLIPARANFAVLLFELAELDWFHLSHDGHVRARLVRGEGDGWTGCWIAP